VNARKARTLDRLISESVRQRLWTAGVAAVLLVAALAMAAGAVAVIARWPLVGVFSLGCGLGAGVGLFARSTWLRRVLEAKGWLDEEITSLKRANYLAARELQNSAEQPAVTR
jgi:hypothetical protein